MMRSLGQDYAAIVIGASGGIGQALVAALRGDPHCARLVQISRTTHPGFDLTDEASIAAIAQDAAALGAVHLVIDATGALTIDGRGPEKTIRAIDPETMAAQFAVNAIGPALLLKHMSRLLARDRRAVFATLSARVGSIGDNRTGGWISYRASKAALNQIVKTAAIEIARTHPRAAVVAIHPGTVATGLSAPFAGARPVLSPAGAAAMILAVLDGIGADATGGFFAYDGSPIVW